MMTLLMRSLFYLSTALGGFLTLVYFGAVAGEHGDIRAVAASMLTVWAFGWGLDNMQRERKLNATPLARLYIGIWIYWVAVVTIFAAIVAITGQNPFELERS